MPSDSTNTILTILVGSGKFIVISLTCLAGRHTKHKASSWLPDGSVTDLILGEPKSLSIMLHKNLRSLLFGCDQGWELIFLDLSTFLKS